MPFIQQTPRVFTCSDIEVLTPGQSGVYGLFRQDAWVYIGKGDIRTRLLDHLNGDNPCILREWLTGWVGEVFNGDPSARERDLIIELQPVCNQRAG